MSNVTHRPKWNPDLCIQLTIEGKKLVDFNRLLIKNLPSTEDLKKSKKFKDADRKDFIHQIKARYDEIIKEGGSHEKLYGYFVKLSQYIRWCDKRDVETFTQSSIEGYMNFEDERVMLGQIKNSTYRTSHALLQVIFTQYLDLPHSYFDNIVTRYNHDTEPFEAYTRSDLKQILPFLRALFKQTHQQFIDNPEKHIQAYRNIPTMTFHWKGCEYKLCAATSKMMSAATYLMGYYTYANTSDLFKLKQPENASTTIGEVWYTMPAFKRRAFKTIRIEMGEHELEIPKYSMDFFDKLLEASRLISTGGSRDFPL